MEQFEQLLTCAICLDRYRNPKLLPCQHSFCMEPCMDGLVDYVRRQVKCPECRAEHRIPYQGVQGYPTNVTLQRFLELHIEITGELPDPTSGQIMERCSVCSEKSYCSLCVHCDKKVCADCKGAHMDILRREITRINNQVRRGIHRLQDALSLVEKNQITLLSNCTSVTEEVDEIHRRLMKAMKDRTESLRSEIERYQSTEQRNLRTLKDNLEQELSNIQSNCELADKHMNDNVDWDDCELMDAKEIFLKTVEFIRNFEYENVDYTRRVRFSMATDPNQLVLHVANYGDLTIASPYPSMPGPGVGGGGGSGLLQPPAAGPGLMRSKSDHRLASQFRQEERGGYFDGEGGGQSAGGRASPLGGRKFGERYSSRGYGGGESSRYGRGADDYGRGGGGGGGDYEYDEGGGSGGRASRRYRSRLASRHLGGGDGDSDNDAVGVGGRSVRFSGDCGGGGGGGSSHHAKERERVLDTEDASRGPLSGITRLLDSPRVMKRLQESEQRGKKREKEPAPAPTPQATTKAATTPARRTPASRQVSEDDEISKIKKQNKASGSGVETTPATTAAADSTTTATTPSSRPQSERVAALKQQRSTDAGSEESSSGAEPARRTPPATVQEVATSDGESDDTSSAAGANTTTKSTQRKTSTGTASTPGRRTSDAGTKKVAVRSASSESSTSSESSSSAAASPVRTTAPASATASAGGDSSGTSTPRGRASSGGSETQPRFQSRFLASRQQAAAAAAAASSTKEEEDEEETESSSSSEETESEEESEDEAAKKKTAEPAPAPSSTTRAVDRTDIGPLLARSAHARDSSDTPATSSRRRDSRDEGSSTTAGYRRYSTDASTTPSYRYGANKDKDKEDTGSKYLSRNRTKQQDDETPSSRYGSSGYTSRFLNKSKSSAALSPEEDSDSRKYGAGSSTSTAAGADDSSSRYPSGRSRYAALKDRRSRLARSRSTHNFGGDDQEEQDDSPSSPTSSGMPASYLPSRYAAGSSTADLARSRSTHALKSRENSPERPSASGSGASGSGEKDGAALSSWARYLKNKYGNRAAKDGKDGASGSGSSLGSGAGSSTSASRRLSLGLPLRHNSASIESSDDDQKNPAGSPTSPTAAGFAAAAGTSPRSQYLQKRRQLFKIGSRGSEPGNFTWPRGIAVGPDNSIVVADSSNHRVQVFDANGTFTKEFGSYGSGEGEFDCLAGVAVNRIGQFIIADRYNHRIQVMDPAGRFLRAFGSQGSSDGRFNYPWGVTTDALGFIYVCDKENHRVQVFQSDGTFVGKFGSIGNKPGQLEHPHYIAVSNTNRVIVSDSNNHRVQIFDVNGKVVTTFGNEGSEDGQFKFPRHAKRVKSTRPRGSHPSHRAITTKSTKPVTSNTSVISTSAPSTIAIKQGRRSGRPGLHLCGGLRQQPHPNLQPRRHIPEGIRLLGLRGRGVQRTGGYSSYIQRQHPGVRSGEPSHTSVLSSAANKRLNLNTAENGRNYGPLRRASLPIIKDRFLAPPILLTRV